MLCDLGGYLSLGLATSALSSWGNGLGKSETACRKSDHPDIAMLERPWVGTWVDSPAELSASTSCHHVSDLPWMLWSKWSLKTAEAPPDFWPQPCEWLHCPCKHVLNSWSTKTWAKYNGFVSPWDWGSLLWSHSNWNHAHWWFSPEPISLLVAAKIQL